MGINKSNILSWVKFFVGWPLSILSILFIVKYVYDQNSSLNLSFSDINPIFLVLGIFLFFAYFLLRSYLWQTLLKEKNYKIPFGENTYRFAFSELKRFTPGNIWSFLSRASLFNELGVDKKTIGVSTIADIQLVIIGCGIISVFAIPLILNPSDQLRINLQTLLPISVFLIVLYFLIIGAIYKKRFDKNASFFSSIWLPSFKINSKLKVGLISVFTYFMFGIWNYFILISIYPLVEANLLVISSFFVFSLLVGYLSFITPMGLGVRELIIASGLSAIMSTADAGAVSIFTRIVLVLSELFFLVLIFLWVKSLSKT